MHAGIPVIPCPKVHFNKETLMHRINLMMIVLAIPLVIPLGAAGAKQKAPSESAGPTKRN